MAVLSEDYFAVPDEQFRQLESVLTIVDGKVVFAAAEFSALDPALPPVSPDWVAGREIWRLLKSRTNGGAGFG